MIKTALYEATANIPNRIAELEVMMTHAATVEIWLANGCFDDGYPFIKKKRYSVQPAKLEGQLLLDSLCRSCCVLLVSQLEGFLKDINKALVADLNENVKKFSNMPESLKRTFCEKIAFYDNVPDEEINTRAKQLVSYFESNSVPIDFSAFKYKESSNKNPTSSFIDSSFTRYGIHSMLNTLSNGLLYLPFENDLHKDYTAMRESRRDRRLLLTFPYKQLPLPYKITHWSKKQAPTTKSLWYDYVTDILNQRHQIVHGDTTANHSTIVNLKKDIAKLNILMHGISYSVADFFGKQFA